MSKRTIWMLMLALLVICFAAVCGQKPELRVTDISATDSHQLALLQDGTVLAWGANNYGQLGRITKSADAHPVKFGNLTRITAIAVGGETTYDMGLMLMAPFGGSSSKEREDAAAKLNKSTTTGFSLALKTDGTIWACGDNGYGELGIGETVGNSKVPVQVKSLANVRSLAAGGNYCLALTKDGTVWGWGDNDEGQLGDGTDAGTDPRCGNLSSDQPAVHHMSMLPGRVKNLTGITAISAAGCYSSFALKSDGTVWGWGWNGNGELGIGKATEGFVSVPTHLKKLDHIIAIASGGSHSLALDKAGSVWVWGLCAADGHNHPVRMRIVNGTMVNTERADEQASKSIGQLGNGSDDAAATPVRVNSLKDVVAVSAYGEDSMALRQDGTVWAWGANSHGQLGDGTFRDRTSPVQVNGLTQVTKIVFGPSCGFAWKKDGSVWGWGDNSKGQLSRTKMKSSNVPVRLTVLTGK